MTRAHTYRCTRIRRWAERSNDTEILPLRPFCRGCIIATREFDFRKGYHGVELADPEETVTMQVVAKGVDPMKVSDLKSRRAAPLLTPTDLGANATRDVGAALNLLLADTFALYVKTKNFHWHMSGPHFRDYHLLLDEQGDQIFAMADPLAERVRKLGGTTLRSIGHIARTQRVLDNDAEYVTPQDMLAELRDDNRQMAAAMREAHEICDENGDVASASLIEVWIDETERRVWFLFEASRRGDESGR
jgi:starvation-inducible DNA-binding protein